MTYAIAAPLRVLRWNEPVTSITRTWQLKTFTHQLRLRAIKSTSPLAETDIPSPAWNVHCHLVTPNERKSSRKHQHVLETLAKNRPPFPVPRLGDP